MFRREQAYFWNPLAGARDKPVAFQIDPPGATVAIEENHIEGSTGVANGAVIEIKRPEDAVKAAPGK